MRSALASRARTMTSCSTISLPPGRRIVAESPEKLPPGGLLALEVGDSQARAVIERIAYSGAFGEARVGDAHAARVTLARAEKLVNELPPAQFHASMSTAIASKRKALFEPPTASRR